MKINYIKELNSSKINLSPLNFWQAIGITILFDIITLFLNKPTDIFYIILNSLGVVTYSGFWMWISTALSAAYEFGAILILIIFLNNRNNKVNNINTDDIKYVIHENKKTAVFLIEGKSIETWIPMKDIYENLPKNDFLNIQGSVTTNG